MFICKETVRAGDIFKCARWVEALGETSARMYQRTGIIFLSSGLKECHNASIWVTVTGRHWVSLSATCGQGLRRTHGENAQLFICL